MTPLFSLPVGLNVKSSSYYYLFMISVYHLWLLLIFLITERDCYNPRSSSRVLYCNNILLSFVWTMKSIVCLLHVYPSAHWKQNSCSIHQRFEYLRFSGPRNVLVATTLESNYRRARLRSTWTKKSPVRWKGGWGATSVQVSHISEPQLLSSINKMKSLQHEKHKMPEKHKIPEADSLVFTFLALFTLAHQFLSQLVGKRR